MERFAIEAPLAGVLLRSGRIPYVKTRPVPVDLAAVPGTLIETELGYRFSSTVKTLLPDEATLRAKVAAIHPVVELPGGRREVSAKPERGVDLAAGNVGSARYIIGPGRGLGDLEPNAIEVVLARGGAGDGAAADILHRARGSDAWGDQWKALRWVINQRVGQGYTIEPGQIVITGALGPIRVAEPGDYRAGFGALGEIVFRCVGEPPAPPPGR